MFATSVGLVMAALPKVTSARGWIGPIDIALLLLLGAVVGEAPQRAGIVASGAVGTAALLQAGLRSLGSFVIVLLLSPIFVLVSGRVAKVGATLVARRTDRIAEGEDREADEQRRRGQMLLGLAVVIVGAAVGSNAWASAAVETEAKRDAARLEEVLSRTTVPEILLSPADLPADLAIRAIAKETDGASITLEVMRLWQVRCVTGHLNDAGKYRVDIEDCPLRQGEGHARLPTPGRNRYWRSAVFTQPGRSRGSISRRMSALPIALLLPSGS